MVMQMARAAYHGFPPKLEDLAEAMPLANKKDKEGHGNMLRMARPRGFNKDGSPRWWHEEEPERRAHLTAYCIKDVLAEQEAARRLPELPEREQQIWQMDAAINDRGILIDVVGTDSLMRVTGVEVERLNAVLAETTGGAVETTTKLPALKRWLSDRGISISSLDKDHMAEALAREDVQADPLARKALELRKEGSQASTAKLKPMLGTLGSDDRARGLFRYYGAGRTGRWAGQRIQPQNLVRGLKESSAIIDAIIDGADPQELAAQQGCSVLALVAGCLRGLFVAPMGRRLVAADLSQIECRVLAWLAGQDDKLEVLRDKEQDLYLFTASKLGTDNRQLGKAAELGLGFNMGAERFVDAAKSYGVVLTEEEAEDNVRQWRLNNPDIVRLWRDTQDAAVAVATGPVGGEEDVGYCTIRRRRDSTPIRLPSGRELIYHGMTAIKSPDRAGFELSFMGVHQLSRKWTRQRTYGGKLCENITQAVARDVLADAMLTLHKRGHEIVGSVHDEVLLEADTDKAEAVLEEALEVMRTTPEWAPGLPVDAKGFVSPRYRKD
jgi:hypothetical protein